MVDDDNDKTRRNLVVWSAAIIAVWSLDIRIGQVAGEVWVLKGSSAAPWKLWLAASLVHAYLWVRYRFSPDGVQTQALGALERHRFYKEYTTRRLRDEASALCKGKKVGRSWITKPETVTGLLKRFSADDIAAGISWEASEHESAAVAKGFKPVYHPMDGEFRLVARTLVEQRGELSAGISKRQRIEVPKLRSFGYGLKARAVVALYSEASAKAVLPRILAAIAAAVLAWQLGVSIWSLVNSSAV